MRDSIKPDITLFTQIEREYMDKKTVVTVIVQRGTARPYYLAGKGIRPEGVFVRQGASTVPATETAILHMIRETGGSCYEDERSLNQQLTFLKTAAYFKKKNIAFGESQKKTLRLIGEDETYTNLALLLSEQCPHTIKLAVFEGDKKAIFKDRREFSGSLLFQLEEAFDFIDRFNRTRAEFMGLDRIDRRDYPPQAIREALLNAIVHRDYAYSGSTLISIFDSRLEIVTIGGLVKGMSQKDLTLGVSIPRNERLADVFYRLRLIEAYGTGLPRIMEYYEEYTVEPQIEVSDNAFKITLPNINSRPALSAPPSGLFLSDKEKQVLELFERQEAIVRTDVETALNVSQPTAITLLRRMTEKNLLKKINTGRFVKYMLAENIL